MRSEFRGVARTHAWRGIALALGLAGVAATAAADDSTPINKRAAADPAGQVEVSNTSGSVIVTGWDRREVEVTGELGEGSERLEFTTSGKLTRIKVILPKKSWH